MPTEVAWRKICRNLQDLEGLRDSIVTIPETHKKISNLAKRSYDAPKKNPEKFGYK